MRAKILMTLAIVLMVAPMVAAQPQTAALAAAFEAAQAIEASALPATPMAVEAVTLNELAGDVLFAQPLWWEDCGQSGACNQDMDCNWMRNQCPLHTIPACEGSTGSGCYGDCVCSCN